MASTQGKCAAALVGATLPFAASLAGAQEKFPTQPVRIVVAYGAGGGVDITARLLAEPLRKALGQPVVVDNRPGASGMIGAQAVAKAAPDGHTLLLAAAGEVAVNQHLYRTMAYSPDRDLLPITLVVRIPNVLVVNADVQARSVADLIALARAHPGKLTYSSSGVGNPQHLAGELLNRMAGIDTTHIPFKGAAQQLADVAGKNVSMTFSSIAAAQPFIAGDKVRPIAVTSAGRVAALPAVPALAEYKPLAGYELVNWFAMFAPARTPAAVAARLNALLVETTAMPEIAGKLRDMGSEPATLSLAQTQAFVQAETAKFGRIVRDANVHIE